MLERDRLHVQGKQTLASDHVGDLNHRINLGFWEDTFPASTFDIETQDTEGSNPGPLAIWSVGNHIIPPVQSR